MTLCSVLSFATIDLCHYMNIKPTEVCKIAKNFFGKYVYMQFNYIHLSNSILITSMVTLIRKKLNFLTLMPLLSSS